MEEEGCAARSSKWDARVFKVLKNPPPPPPLCFALGSFIAPEKPLVVGGGDKDANWGRTEAGSSELSRRLRIRRVGEGEGAENCMVAVGANDAELRSRRWPVLRRDWGESG